MDPITQQVVLATAGAAGAGEATYVDDVFSTFLYDGTGSTQTINNGIDLSGEGSSLDEIEQEVSDAPGRAAIALHKLFDAEAKKGKTEGKNKKDKRQLVKEFKARSEKTSPTRNGEDSSNSCK